MCDFNEITCYFAELRWKKKNKNKKNTHLHWLPLISLLGLSACLPWNRGAPLCFFISFPFSRPSLPSLMPSRSSLHVKTAGTWCSVKGMDTVHRPWAICSSWLKGSVNIFSGQILISIQWEVPSCSVSEPNLCVYVGARVCLLQYLSVSSRKRGPWATAVPTHLISATSTLLSLHFHHSNKCVCVCVRARVCVWAAGCMRISVCRCDSVYVFMHKTCWCVWFCSSKMTRWPDCYQMKSVPAWVG